MKELFSEYPTLSNDRILLRKMTEDDAEALQAFAHAENVYRFLPTFLYEQKYEDAHEVIARMDAECFDTKESILLAICRREEPECLIGIAEIYNYEKKKEKASIGCRLSEEVWGQGIATQTIGLLKEYLMEEIGLRTITAHIMHQNIPSAKAAMNNGFLCKYPDIYGDWGLPELIRTDKYVFKREWMDRSADGSDAGVAAVPPVQVEQFVMAYEIEQDRIRALLPEGFESLRPVLRINAEIRSGHDEHDRDVVYVEFNTPVAGDGRRGWMNIANWKSSSGDALEYKKEDQTTTFTAPFLELAFTGTGREGGCPAEMDNDGCFFQGDGIEFRPAEKIEENREFCECEFAWRFHEGDACGASDREEEPAFGAGASEDRPAFAQKAATQSEHLPLTAENAAAIPCRKVLGAYRVSFERYGKERPDRTIAKP